MAKTVALSNADLAVASKGKGASRQRGEPPSAELIPMQFRMSAEFVRQFKQAALDRGMKLNELLNDVFQQYMKT
jgi:hypothetical protein